MKKTQITVRGKSDSATRQIRDALKQYAHDHPQATIDIYRQLSMVVQVRIIDPDFAGIGWADRHDLIWTLFANLPEEVLGEIYVLLLLTPEEAKSSFANMEFDQPAAVTK